MAAGDEDVALLQAKFFRYVPECLSSIDDNEPERSNLVQPMADCVNWQPNAIVTDHWHEQAVTAHTVVVECEQVQERVSRNQATADVSTNWHGGNPNTAVLSFEFQDPSITRPDQIGYEDATRVLAKPSNREFHQLCGPVGHHRLTIAAGTHHPPKRILQFGNPVPITQGRILTPDRRGPVFKPALEKLGEVQRTTFRRCETDIIQMGQPSSLGQQAHACRVQV